MRSLSHLGLPLSKSSFPSCLFYRRKLLPMFPLIEWCEAHWAHIPRDQEVNPSGIVDTGCHRISACYGGETVTLKRPKRKISHQTGVIISPFSDAEALVIRPCGSRKIRLQDVVGATLRMKLRVRATKDTGGETVIGGVILWFPIFLSKNEEEETYR